MRRFFIWMLIFMVVGAFLGSSPITFAETGLINQTITLASPKGGENWQAGTTHNIT